MAAKNKPLPLIPLPGERSLIIGLTGSGKTAFAAWLLKRLETSPLIIYDTKIEDKFHALRPNAIVESVPALMEAVDNPEVDYVIMRPPVHMLREPLALDELLFHHYENLPGVPAYIDEAYSFHNGGRAGPGLVALLTRGRSKGITTTISTQQPAWISRFCFTEAQRFYVFQLLDKRDKKRLSEVIPGFMDVGTPPKYGFHFYRTDEQKIHRFNPIKLDPALNTGYTDSSVTQAAPAEAHARKRIWL